MENTTKELLTTIAENQPKIKAQGFEEGKKAEYDAFWDSFQSDEKVAQYGYEYAFMRPRWTDELFRPKKDLKGKNFYWAFYGTGITDLQACLDRQGVKLDTSQAQNVASIFQSANKCKRFPSLDLRSVTATITNLYFSCWSAETIGTIILKDDGSQVMNESCFYDTPKLENIAFEGKIGNGLKMAWSPLLSVESLKNIIKHLKNYFGTSSEWAYTLTIKSSVWSSMYDDFDDDDYAWIEENFDTPKDTFIEMNLNWSDIVYALRWNLVLA